MSAAEIIEHLRALPTDERREVVAKILDEFADQDVAVTSAQADELDRRLAEHRRDGDAVVPWAEIKAGVAAKTKRPA